jgi:hypothetical protein
MQRAARDEPSWEVPEPGRARFKQAFEFSGILQDFQTHPEIFELVSDTCQKHENAKHSSKYGSGSGPGKGLNSMRKNQLAVAVLAFSWLSGCATLTEGINQAITIDTPGAPGAICMLANDANDILGSVTTPGSIEIGKSRKDVTVRCSKHGFESAQKRVSSTWAERAKLQGPEGYVVDYVSGAMWSYPPKIEIVLTSNGPVVPPRARRGTAQPTR